MPNMNSNEARCNLQLFHTTFLLQWSVQAWETALRSLWTWASPKKVAFPRKKQNPHMFWQDYWGRRVLHQWAGTLEALRGAFKTMKRTDASLAAEARGCDLQPHASRIARPNSRNRDPKTQKSASERNKNIVEIGSFTLEKNRRRNNCKSAIYIYIARFFTQRVSRAPCRMHPSRSRTRSTKG